MSVRTIKQENPSVHHCPVKDCLYQSGSERYFTTKRLLNQHIEKVHAEKKYMCNKCQKGFGTDWLRKYHEMSCGRSWDCSCGLKYSTRESLLSHVRRKEHTVSEEYRFTPRKVSLKNTKKGRMQPVVFVIQPIIQQQVSFVLPPWTAGAQKRLILPKKSSTQPSDFTSFFLANSEMQTQCNTGNGQLNEQSSIPATNLGVQHPSQQETIGPSRPAKCGKDSSRQERKPKSRVKRVAETQTCDELSTSKSVVRQIARTLESRGSQCTGQVRKQRVRIESTHTQTMESAVVKMKKKNSGTRSRRKSVAVVTESDMLQPTSSLWSEIDNFILPPAQDKDVGKLKSCSTQTVPVSCFASCSKVMCDSQSQTADNDLFPFDWSFVKDNLLGDDQTFRMSDHLQNQSDESMQIPAANDQLKPNDSISGRNDRNLKDFVLWNGDKCTNKAKYHEDGFNKCSIPLLTTILDNCTTTSTTDELSNVKIKDNTNVKYSTGSTGAQICAELANFDSMLDTVINSANNLQDDNSPLLLNTETQTNSPLGIDYSSILANMETQTTDDFLFSDLEFSDTETQTPWEDIASFGDGLTNDQLSIEIQTDFSSAAPFENENKLDNMLMPIGRHMETQTLDTCQIPQLTNSEAQTLNPPSYLFV